MVHTTQRKNLECTFSSGDNDRSRNSSSCTSSNITKVKSQLKCFETTKEAS